MYYNFIIATYIDKILLDMKYLHADCENATIPIFMNNINFDMEEFKVIGDLVSLNDIISNVMNYRVSV